MGRHYQQRGQEVRARAQLQATSLTLASVPLTHARTLLLLSFEFDTVPGNNVIVFVRRGAIEVQGKPVESQGVAIMKRDDSTKVVIKAKRENSQILVLAGEPIDEPIAAQGPFVMNTFEEIQQANIDFHSGSFGT